MRRVVFLVCVSGLMWAQNVGIGTSTPASRLHVAGLNATLTVGPFGIGQAEGRIVAVGSSAEISFVRRTLVSWPGTPAAGDRFVWYNPDGTARLWTEGNGDLVTVTAAGNVGMGTATPHAAARLHVAGADMGVLLPTAALTSATAWSPLGGTPQAGMIVYNTATAGTPPNDVGPGYYYWDGTRWVRMDGGTEAWLLTGNAGTDPTINFLGTTDGQPLVIRVNNQETFRFNAPGTTAPGWSLQRGGGNTRGVHAVDLQSGRTTATQVASGDYGVISGGFMNTASGAYSAVGGGLSNAASGIYCTVSGGVTNHANGDHSTVSGGGANNASGDYSTIGGGLSNAASGIYSTVGGGVTNHANGDYSTVSGGTLNTASGYGSTVSGGSNNTASGDNSVVAGGVSNTANAAYNLVFGQNVDPSVAETHRVYFFGDGSSPGGVANPSGFLVINRLDGDYPIHVGTNGTNGNGAYLSAGGVWTNISSRAKKDRFRPLDAGEVLERIRALPVEGWYYKGTNEYHIGPYAEGFHDAFGTGVLDNPEDA
ncbi:MAG: hypothetical protein N3A68_03770, partial [Bacteroidia bacterium]|nr:hypothetical protein [Bacteroidia bacterium]